MNPVIAIDLNGALLKSRPFEKAHKNWFYVMSILLKDKSIIKYSKLDNYFDKVNEIMQRYLGNINPKTRTTFARNLFSMLTVSEVKKEDLVQELVDYLLQLKKKYTLVLITSAPELSVEPILEKIGCSELFDIVYKSPLKDYPNKLSLFKRFIKEKGKIEYYIGAGDKDILEIKKLGIKTISVNWIVKGEFKGDYDVKKVRELKEIIG